MAPHAWAAKGDCGQPVTNGASPSATDCLFILRVATGLATCTPACICQTRGQSSVTTTDALLCLRSSVGQPVTLNCPCGSTTSSTTTTTVPAAVSCAFTSATCAVESCSCFGVLEGFDYHLGAAGTASGPVGTQARVNTILGQGGVIDCGSWTRIGAGVNASCDTIGCCQRGSGDPETTAWSVFEAFDLPCLCPSAPGPLEHNFVVQCQLNANPVEEHERTTDPCP